MSVHKRANNGTYYVAYRDAAGRQHTKTFGKGREGKRDAQKFDQEIKVRKLIEAGMNVARINMSHATAEVARTTV